jgi:hypothetical protein
MIKMKETKRFVRVYKEGTAFSNEGYKQLLVDRETGVTYLFISAGYGSSITPLLDASGNPVITRIQVEY